MSRYQTLNVNLLSQNQNQDYSMQAQTLDLQKSSLSQNEQGDRGERVKRFRQLYFKNQKLRKQLKILNGKLNQKLQKVKFPNVKKKALSVDFTQNAPISKAQQRELQNAYKQIKMYKNQIEVLKVKQQTPQSYGKVRNMENAITYKDMEISEVLEQLKSIKSIKKMQQKKITSQLNNEEVIQRISQYQKQQKQLKLKLKELAAKDRKRQQDFKKQQAYLVSIQKKLRKIDVDEKEEHKFEKEKDKQEEVNEVKWQNIKKQMENQKIVNEEIQNKIQVMRRTIKKIKLQNNETNQIIKDKQAMIKLQHIKIQSLKRLTRQKKVQQNHDQTNFPSKISQFLQYQDSDVTDPIISHPDTVKKFTTEDKKDKRQWIKKTRKLSNGFSAQTDIKFHKQGKLKGIRVFLDEDEGITGLSPLMEQQQQKSEPKKQQLFGSKTNVEHKWKIQQNDEINVFSGSFNEQGYLTQIAISSKKGMSAAFGNASSQSFSFKLHKNQSIQGVYGSYRVLGKDTKITQIGVWVSKLALDDGQLDRNPSSYKSSV